MPHQFRLRRTKVKPDPFKNAFEAFYQIVIPKAPDFETVFCKALGPRQIRFLRDRRFVLAAIEFDNVLMIEADEICDVGTNGLLAAKLESVKTPAPECIPKLAFDVCLIAAQRSGEIVLHEDPSPGALSRAALSHKGEGNLARLQSADKSHPGIRASSADRISAIRALARCFTLSLLSWPQAAMMSRPRGVRTGEA